MVKIKHFLYITFILMSSLIVLYSFKQNNTDVDMNLPEYNPVEKYPNCLKMYYAIEKYSKIYNIPKNFAYGIAYNETGYKHPFQWGYNHKQISSSGALGPMQVLLSTAKWVWNDNTITKEKMLNDIDFNIETSMKYLNLLHKQYREWKIVFGYYNTGYPIINSYALNVYQHQT